MKATVNFSNMFDNVLSQLSNCQLHISELSALERVTDKAKEKAKKAGKTGKDLQKAIATERKNEKDAKERTTQACNAFIIRNVTTEDIASKEFDVYHIDWDGFLKNIGVVSDGEMDKKATAKTKAIVAKAVDRYKDTVARRKRGEDRFSDSETKEVKNNVIDLVSAFIYACVDSGAIEHVGGGLAKVDFSEKDKAREEAKAKAEEKPKAEIKSKTEKPKAKTK